MTDFRFSDGLDRNLASLLTLWRLILFLENIQNIYLTLPC